MEDITAARKSLIQFANIFASLQLTLEQHDVLKKAVDGLSQLLDRFEASGWARAYDEQIVELRDESLEKTLSL